MCVIKEEAKECTVVFACPGLSANDLTVTFEKETCCLNIDGKASDKEFDEFFDTDISYSEIIQKKYASDDISYSVKNGIGKVVLGISKDVVVVQSKDIKLDK